MQGHQVALPCRPTIIAPLGDIQWTVNPERDIAVTALKAHIARALAFEKQGFNVRFLGMGDYIDYMSPGNRRRHQAAGLHDNALDTADEAANRLIESLYGEVLAPTTGKWLGMLRGHHFHKYESGETSDNVLMKKLGAKHLGDSCFIQLGYKFHGSGGVIVLWAHHGEGSGSKLHSMLLKIENLLPFWEADAFFVGHLPKLAHSPANRVYASFPHKGGDFRLRHKTIHLVCTGGWYKSYVENAMRGSEPGGAYPEKKMLTPVVLGAPLYYVTPKWDRVSDPALGRRANDWGYRQHKWFNPETRVEV